MAILKKHRAKATVVILLFFLFGLYSKTGQAVLESIFLTSALATEGKFTPIDFFTTKPIMSEVSYPSGNEIIIADLWVPNERRESYPAAVLNLGVNIDRKDPRTQKIAESFARTGMIIIVPNIPSISQREVSRKTPSYFIDSFKFLEKQKNVNKNKLGFLGFCASGGISLLAAENPQINQKVSFVLTVNPYFDLKSLYKALTIRKVYGQKWIPHFKTVELYNKESILLLKNPKDEQILKKYLVNIPKDALSYGNFPNIPSTEFNRLSSEGKLTYQGLTNKDPQKINFYLKNATEEQKEYIKNMSPSTNISKLKAKIFILLDKYNVYMPQDEGLALKQALPKNQYYFKQTYASTLLGKVLSPWEKIGETKNIILFLFKFLQFAEK